MRNVKTREGMEYWDKICSLKHYGFIHSPDNSRVLKTEGIGNWIDKFEAQAIVDQAQDEINQFRAERDALQLLLNQRDEQVETLKLQRQGEPVAWQIRSRANRPDSVWTGWRECSEMERAMHSHEVGKFNRFGIMREIRPLYTAQPAPTAAPLDYGSLDPVQRLAVCRGEQPVPVALDERAEFVKWVRQEWPQAPLSNVRDLLPKDDPRYGEYCDEALQRAWVGWQARAYLDELKRLNPSL